MVYVKIVRSPILTFQLYKKSFLKKDILISTMQSDQSGGWITNFWGAKLNRSEFATLCQFINMLNHARSKNDR